jgi:ATP-dependent DNA ligase
MPLPFESLEPMEAKSADALPGGHGWRFEPKWDGFRCLAFKDSDKVWLQAKSGKSLSRFFPEVVAALAAAAPERFILDGELTIRTNAGLSFEALQMRLHPAQSRIDKLSAASPARLVAFDCLADERGDYLDRPWTDRHAALNALVERLDSAIDLSEGTDSLEKAQSWLSQPMTGRDGVVAKRHGGPYTPGERTMVKVKRIRTADCVVGGFRYLAGKPLVGSLLLGVYNDAGLLDHVGFTATISNADRPDLTKRLEALVESPGFTGDAPGGPSRWSTDRSVDWKPLRSELVVEVAFDHVSGGRFRHGTRLLRWRPDKHPDQCRREQLDA